MKKRKFGTIVQIGDILVSEDVVTDFFACDYPVCRGACCIIGDSGAPMEESEKASIGRDYPAFSSLMTPGGRAAVEKRIDDLRLSGKEVIATECGNEIREFLGIR